MKGDLTFLIIFSLPPFPLRKFILFLLGKKRALFLIHFLPRGLCLENSPRILKVPSTLDSGFFLFTPFFLNSLALQKGERIQRVFFE